MTPAPGDPLPPRAGRAGKSLRVRVGLVVGSALLLLLAALMVMCALMIEYFFADLQDRLTSNKIQRIAIGVNQLGLAKIRQVRDSAESDETYDFLGGTDDGYLARNFGPGVNSSGQDLVLLYDAQRQFRASVRSEGEGQPYAPPAGMDLERLAQNGLLRDVPAAGLAVDGDRVLLLASCPVLRSDRTGPSNGWLVYGTYFSKELTHELAQISGSGGLEVRPSGSLNLPGNISQVAVSQPYAGKGTAYFKPARSWRPGEPFSNILLVLNGADGSRSIAMELNLSLVVYLRALEARNWIILGSLVCGVIAVFVGLFAVEVSVLKPLADLDHQMRAMAAGEGEIGQLSVRRDDEIGRLAASANRLLHRAVSGRREAEEQRALVDSILDSANEGIEAFRSVRNAEGGIEDFEAVVVNRAAERICGLPKSGVTGKRMLEMFPKLKSAGVFDRCVRVAESGRPETFEIDCAGHNIAAWMRFSIAPWGDGVLLTFEDISERKLRERELAESYAELERFNAAMIGREERIMEIKEEVNALRAQLGLPPAYAAKSHEP